LVAEDNASTIVPGRFPALAGMVVDTAANGLIAIEKFTANPYDLVLMDGQMPRMDGFETPAASVKWKKTRESTSP
jgi:CheY-like chemotaxis protein